MVDEHDSGPHVRGFRLTTMEQALPAFSDAEPDTGDCRVGVIAVSDRAASVRLSRGAERLLGFTPGRTEVTLKDIADRIADDDRHRFLAALGWAADGKMTCQLHVGLAGEGGREVLARVTGLSDAFLPPEVMVTLRDPHTVETAEAPSCNPARERMLERVLEAAHVGTWDYDPQTERFALSSGAAGYLEQPVRKAHELSDVLAAFDEDAADALDVGLSLAAKGLDVLDLELPVKTGGGRDRWVRIVGEQAQGADGDPHLIGIIENVTQRREGQEEFRQRAEGWALALSGSGASVWDWDLRSGSVEFSPSWKQALGYEPHELTDSIETWHELLHPDDREPSELAIQNFLIGVDDHLELEHRLRHRSGEYLWFLGCGRITEHDERGVPVRFTGTNVDITEKVAIREALREAMVEAQQAAHAKSEFLAHMSHEIRTPLNAVLGMGQLLLTEDLPEDLEDRIATIVHSGDVLLELINDVLDHAKLEAGRVQVEKIPMDVGRMIEEVSMIQLPRALEQETTLEAAEVDPVLRSVLGDPARVRQIILNFVGNAVKFTAQGSVTVRAFEVDAIEAERRMRIEVEDTGIGISPEAQARLFSSYTQAENTTTRVYGGTGLGLAISKKLADLLGGEVGVVSAPGEGSTFWIELPFVAVADKVVDNRIDEEEAALPDREIRVLVAEDNEVNQRVATQVLEKLGCEAVIARNGLEAVELASCGTFDVILMDLQMPQLDGYGATMEIRRREQESGHHTPIVGLTANAQLEVRDACHASGMDDFLTKPFRIPELRGVLARSIRTDSDPG